MSQIVEKLRVIKALLLKKSRLASPKVSIGGIELAVFRFIQNNKDASQSEIVSNFPNINERTVRRYIHKLIKLGFVKKRLDGRIVRYKAK